MHTNPITDHKPTAIHYTSLLAAARREDLIRAAIEHGVGSSAWTAACVALRAAADVCEALEDAR